MRHEFDPAVPQAADQEALAALPEHVRAKVLSVLENPQPEYAILRDGTRYPLYAVVTSVTRPGTVHIQKIDGKSSQSCQSGGVGFGDGR